MRIVKDYQCKSEQLSGSTPRRATASSSRESGSKDVFVHISAVERAGLSTLKEGQKISFEIVADKRSGRTSAGNLQAA